MVVISVVPVLQLLWYELRYCLLVPVVADDVRIQITACGLSPVIRPEVGQPSPES